VLIHNNPKIHKKLHKISVTSFEYKDYENVSSRIDQRQFNPQFRGGFWKYSLLRIFAVIEYMEVTGNSPVIHIENDILLFKNFPFSAIEEFDDLMWTRFNKKSDVGAIMWFPNVSAAIKMKSTFLRELTSHPNHTDMTILSEIASELSNFSLLPSFIGTYDPVCAEIADTLNRKKMSENFNRLRGIFDGAAVGMWLLGEDPRNHFGKLIRHRNLSNSYVMPERISYSYVKESGELFANGHPLYNLHVHSKRVKAFQYRNHKFIARMVRDSRDKKMLVGYLPMSTVTVIREVLARHKLSIFRVLLNRAGIKRRTGV